MLSTLVNFHFVVKVELIEPSHGIHTYFPAHYKLEAMASHGRRKDLADIDSLQLAGKRN